MSFQSRGSGIWDRDPSSLTMSSSHESPWGQTVPVCTHCTRVDSLITHSVQGKVSSGKENNPEEIQWNTTKCSQSNRVQDACPDMMLLPLFYFLHAAADVKSMVGDRSDLAVTWEQRKALVKLTSETCVECRTLTLVGSVKWEPDSSFTYIRKGVCMSDDWSKRKRK